MQPPPQAAFGAPPQMNPGQMHNPNMPNRAAGAGPPPARQQQSAFAPPPMGMNQPPPQQQMQAPPMAPPKGAGSGPKPMSAMMGGPPPGGAQMGANAPMAAVNPSDLVNAYQAMFQQFIQVETNQKVKAETENKLAIMVEKVNNG